MKLKGSFLLSLMTTMIIPAYAQFQHARKQVIAKEHHSLMPTPHQDFQPTQAASNRIVVLQEDFEGTADILPASIPSNWITNLVLDNTNITTTPAFKIYDAETANTGGYWPVPSTAPSNKFAGANDDPEPCDCDLMNAWLETPILDFTGLSNMALYFDYFHDQNFGAGAAKIAISLDSGATFTVIPLNPNDTITDLYVDESYWQNAVVPLSAYDNLNNIQIRFQWSDNGEWVSGYAVDNIVIQEMDALDLVTNKVVFGNWDNASISNGLLDYKKIPLNQVSPIQATAVITNVGYATQTDPTVSFACTQNFVNYGPFTSPTTVALNTLDKDTVTNITSFTPTELGVVTLYGSVSTGTDEINMINNMTTNYMEITQNEYARDNEICQLFYGNATVYEFGNLFDIYQDDQLGAIEVALRYGTTGEGSPITAKLYEFQGLDAAGIPILVDTEQNTIEYAVTAADDNIAGQSNFITLPFADGPAQVQAGKTYLAAVTSTDLTDIAVSGFNTWPGSWFNDGTTWGWTYGIPMVRINSDETLSINNKNTLKTSIRAFPNPADIQTNIQLVVPNFTTGHWNLTDSQGRIVASSPAISLNAGQNTLTIDLSSLANGIYQFQFLSDQIHLTEKITK
jgi:hypothetical protein